MGSDNRKLKSYVWHGDECYFVSTIERDSSAMVSPPMRYSETIAWRYDWVKNERGEQVIHEGDGEAVRQHYAVCERLYRHGVDFNNERVKR